MYMYIYTHTHYILKSSYICCFNWHVIVVTVLPFLHTSCLPFATEPNTNASVATLNTPWTLSVYVFVLNFPFNWFFVEFWLYDTQYFCLCNFQLKARTINT